MSLSCMKTFNCKEIVFEIAFSSNGELLATSSIDCIKIWCVESGVLIRTFNPISDVWCIAFSPSGDRVVAGLKTTTIQFWDVSTGADLHALTGHQDIVRSVAFSPHDGGRTLASVSYDKTARIWNATTGACLHILSEHNDSVKSIAYSPGGNRLVTGSYDHTAKVWDADTGTCLATFNFDRGCSTATFLPDGQNIVAVSYDEVWLLNPVLGTSDKIYELPTSYIESIAVSPCGRMLAIGSFDATIKILNLHTSTCLTTLKRPGAWQNVVMSPNGRALANFFTGNEVQLLDLSELLSMICVSTFIV